MPPDMQAVYPKKMATIHWDPLKIEYPVRKFPETGLSSKTLGHEWRGLPEVIMAPKTPLEEIKSFCRDYSLTRDAFRSEYSVDYNFKHPNKERFYKHSTCTENQYVYPPNTRVSRQPPLFGVHGTTEMKNAYNVCKTPSRLITDKDQFKHPFSMPVDPPPLEPNLHKELEPLDTTHEGFEKYLDPYLTTNRLYHRPYTAEQLNKISNTRDTVTFYTLSDIPMTRTPKVKHDDWRLALGRPKSMYDREKFKQDFREIRTHNKPKWAPGSFRTEIRDHFKPPTTKPEFNIHNYEEEASSKYQRSIAELPPNNYLEQQAILQGYKTENSITGSYKRLCAIIDQYPEKNKRLEIRETGFKPRIKDATKCRFRALVRRVMENLYWLSESEEIYQGDDVKRRVEQAMRAKLKKKPQLLSLKDKALLNKPASERTEAEKRYIYRKIGGLKCFKRYPNNVKRKLAAVTYFIYYGPDRVVVRQNQDAHAMYFVVTGEVTVSVLVFDELLQKNVSVNVFVMNPGDMFGEVSLLHNINRTATCTTTGHCEFLALMKEDFKNVLQASLQKQWDEVKRAMSCFTYFDTLDEVALREGCIVAKMKTFDPNDTILGDGVGLTNFVYFVLSGDCQMIETLKIGVTQIRNKKFYSLYDPFVPKIESDLDLNSKYFKDFKTESQQSQNSGRNRVSGDIETDKSKNRVSGTGTITFSESTNSAVKRTNDDNNMTGEEKDKSETCKNSESKQEKKVSLENTESGNEKVKIFKQITEQDQPSSSTRINPNSLEKDQEPPENYSTYFMQVCIFKPGSTFGFGENMRDRRIVALNRVDCMLLPKVWLMQKNTANIWSRIQHYLEKKIPSKKQLFREFVNQRRWQEAREQIVTEIVSRNKTVNHTTIHDVPYSIRMERMYDI